MKNKQKFQTDPKLKFMYQVRQIHRYHHYAYRIEETHCNWIVHFLKFYDYKIHPRDMGKNHIEAYLSHLAISHWSLAIVEQSIVRGLPPKSEA
jgi:hypothetical protein